MVEVVDVHKKKLTLDDRYKKNIMSLINDQYFALAWFEGQYKPHRHNVDEFIYVIEGHLRMDVDGNIIELEPGCGIKINAGEVHSNMSDQKTLVAVFEPQNTQIEYV